LEELYEYLDTLESKNIEASSEELGDLLLNTFMLARIHEEQNDFSPVTAMNLVCEKLIRRHPHVFGNVEANNPEEVLKVWNKVKVDVEGKKESDDDFFSRIPRSMDKLETALKMQKKMKQVGFDWPNIEGVLDKIDEEKGELIEAINNQTNIEEELGDLLFAVVNLARFLDLDPVLALHRSNQKVRRRFNSVVKHCKEHSIELSYDNIELLNAIWDKVKRED
jgi:MazG family protein